MHSWQFGVIGHTGVVPSPQPGNRSLPPAVTQVIMLPEGQTAAVPSLHVGRVLVLQDGEHIPWQAAHTAGGDAELLPRPHLPARLATSPGLSAVV